MQGGLFDAVVDVAVVLLALEDSIALADRIGLVLVVVSSEVAGVVGPSGLFVIAADLFNVLL
jgi:hypothetical protein